MSDRPMPAPRTPDPALPNEAGRTPKPTGPVGQSHGSIMDAADYWRQFEAEVYFTEKGQEIVGRIEHLGYGEDGVKRAKLPRLSIRTADGVLRTVTAYEAYLRAALLDWLPRVGETIWIRYEGEDTRAVPGLNPSKRFRVKVDRPDTSPPPTGPGTVRGGGPDNGSGAGTK